MWVEGLLIQRHFSCVEDTPSPDIDNCKHTFSHKNTKLLGGSKKVLTCLDVVSRGGAGALGRAGLHACPQPLAASAIPATATT